MAICLEIKKDFGHFIMILCKCDVCYFIELVSILANEDILEKNINAIS